MGNFNLLAQIQEKPILSESSLYEKIHEVKANNEQLVIELNTRYHSPDEVRSYLEAITGKVVNPSVTISLPFYTDFGRHITFGKDIFINQNVTFVDLGGITIEDRVLIGPMCRIITVDHLLDPLKRKGLFLKPVTIKRNAWLGANVTVLPGVTIGENAVVAADSTVTKDVPSNVIVAGTPAKLMRSIEENIL